MSSSESGVVPSPRAAGTWTRALLLVVLGIAVGVANNLAAGPTRKLAWIGSYPARSTLRRENPATPLDGATAPVSPPAPGTPTADTGPGDEALAQVVLPAPDPDNPYVEISSEQARKAWLSQAVFIDARRTAQYQEGHVKGAISIPVWEDGVEAKVAEVGFRVQGDLAAPVVVYCNGGDCEDSHVLSESLWQQGFTNVLVYRDGFPDWLKHSWEVTTGDAP